MDDIVTVLRRKGARQPMLDAATEIERLRKNNQWLADRLGEEAIKVGKLELALMQIRTMQGDPIQIARDAMVYG